MLCIFLYCIILLYITPSLLKYPGRARGGSLSILRVASPFLNQLHHVGWEVGVEIHFLPCAWMDETKGFGVEGLARANLETVFHELLVFGELGASQNLLSSIAFVVEEHMPDVFHVGTDLVGAPRFEDTFHECDVRETFQHIIVGHSVLANFRIRGKHSHLHTVFWIAGDIAFDAPFVFCEVAPHDGVIFTLRRLVEELQTEFRFGISGLGDDEQARCVLVDQNPDAPPSLAACSPR